MAELKIDLDAINNKVKPPFNKAKTELQSAADSLYSVSYIPDYYQISNRNRVQSVLPRNIESIKSDVNSISGWIEGIATRFEEANRKSNSAINSLFSKVNKIDFSNSMIKTGGVIGGVSAAITIEENIVPFARKGFELAENVANGVQNGINYVGAKVSSAWNTFYNSIVKPGVDFFKNCKAKVSNFVTGAVNEIANGVNKINDGITSFAKAGWNKVCEIAQGIGNAFNSAGAWVSSTWNSFCTEVWPNIWDGIQSFGASVCNVVVGLVKGLSQFVESLVDLVAMLGTAVASIGTGIWDGISYLVSLANGTSDEWQSATAAMWQGIMGFVAEDHVGNAFADFYKNNVVGQWLDEHAIDACKSNGIVTNIASEIGYIAGIIILTIATLGAGAAVSGGASAMSFTATSAAIATASGTGKYTQEAWGKARDSSWEGIERLYQKGEITEKEYNTYVAIKNMTDEEWAEIEKDYKNGNINKEQYEQIKRIREMPEDWKTFENGWKGLLYGVANGVWEGVQWYVGGKLAGWAIKGHKIATSAVRVGADTAFNALDTPFRSTIDTVTSGMTWDQAWEQQGGWESFFTNVGIGLVGSAGGEIFDGVKLNKAFKALNESQIFDGLDDATVKELKDSLLYAQQSGEIDLSKLDKDAINNLAQSIRNHMKDFNTKFPDSLQDGLRVLQNPEQVAEYFSDPKGFLVKKLGDHGRNDIRRMTDTEIWYYAKEHLSEEDFIFFVHLYNNRRLFSQEEADLILTFAAYGGPAIEAYLRGVDCEFQGKIFHGKSYIEMNDYFHRSVSAVEKKCGIFSTLENVDIEDAIKMLDNIVENSKPLTESLIVTRNVDDIYYDDEKILNPKVGMFFNDKAFLSTSATRGGTKKEPFGNRKIKLEIEVPAGSKVAYIEPEAIAHTGLGQQEVLLGRNNKYQIKDIDYDPATGQYIIKAQMEQVKSSLQSIMDYDFTNNNTLYYNNYKAKATGEQVDLADVINDMNSIGLMGQCEAEIRDMKMSGIYKSAIAGHGEEHIEDVIFYAIYIAEKENFSKREKKLLIEAAKYHDAGKGVDGPQHGITGAENTKKYLSDFSPDDISIIQAAIEYHSVDDGQTVLSEICDKYNIDETDRDMTERIANALKDADALDRSRFPGNLNETYLRTDTAKSCVESTHQLQEIKGQQFLNNYLAGEIADADRIVIEELRKNGFSDYEIAFWIQYKSSEVGEVIGVWNKINNKINSVLGG